MSETDAKSNHQAYWLELHERLLSDDPVVTYDMFDIFGTPLERYLRFKFPNLAAGVDPDIYMSAVHDALTSYFKSPSKYDSSKSGLMTYLKRAAYRDMQNLLAKETRHMKGRVSLEDVEFGQSDGNDISQTVAEDIDGQRLIESLEIGLRPSDRAVFRLMIEGERSTFSAAKAMGIEHLPSSEQAKQVKRAKDRIKKHIQRKA